MSTRPFLLNLSKNKFSIDCLCRVKEVYKIFINPATPITVQIEILARALSSFRTDELYLLPHIREILEKARKPVE